MGNADTKLVFRKAVVQLTSKTQVSGRGRRIVVYPCSERADRAACVADHQRRGQRFLGSVLVGERYQRAGRFHVGAGRRDTAAPRRRARQSGHVVLQGGGEVCESRREQLPHTAGSKHR